MREAEESGPCPVVVGCVLGAGVCSVRVCAWWGRGQQLKAPEQDDTTLKQGQEASLSL